MTISAVRKQTLWKYLDDVEADHSKQGERVWRQNNHMGQKVFRGLRQEWELAKRSSLEQAVDNLQAGLEGKPIVLADGTFDVAPFLDENGDLDVKAYLNAYKKRILDDLIKICASSAPALKLYYQLTGDLVEKPVIAIDEVNIDFKQLARFVDEARRELNEEGMAQVQDELRTLPADLRLSSGQGADGDG